MTCIRDRPLSELPTIEDFDQILEDLHTESNDWDTASIVTGKQKCFTNV